MGFIFSQTTLRIDFNAPWCVGEFSESNDRPVEYGFVSGFKLGDRVFMLEREQKKRSQIEWLEKIGQGMENEKERRERAAFAPEWCASCYFTFCE